MFRFSIRDVLLVMVIFGLAVGWWLDHRADSARHLKTVDHAELLRTELKHAYYDNAPPVNWKLADLPIP